MNLKDMDNIEISEAIDKYVRGERNRAILKRRLIDEITQEKLAEEFDLSVSHIKRILQKSKEQLFYHLEKEVR